MPNLTKVFPSMLGHVLESPMLADFDATDIPSDVKYRFDTATTTGTGPGPQYGIFWVHRFDESSGFAFALAFGSSEIMMRPLEASIWGAWDNASGPVGAVQMFAMQSAPAGWLEANGVAVSRATYARLFSKIGTTFGAGDGSTTFNLPDLRGEFMRGWDNSRGVDSGRAFGSAQADEIKSHTHTVSDFATGGAGAPFRFAGDSGGPYVASHPVGATGGAETRPRNIALLPCIKH